MDLGGANWTMVIVVIVPLAVVVLWAMLRNQGQKEGRDQTERATDRLYHEEDAARDPMDDGAV